MYNVASKRERILPLHSGFMSWVDVLKMYYTDLLATRRYFKKLEAHRKNGSKWANKMRTITKNERVFQ